MIMISKVIQRRPHSVVATSSYVSSDIKSGQISWAGRQARLREKSDSKPNQQQLPTRTAQGFPKSRRPYSSRRRRRNIASLSAKKDFSGLLRKSIQTPPKTAQCSKHNYQLLNLTALFGANSESLILFETAPAATFLHWRPLHCSSNYHSCTGGHLPAEAATSSAPAATSPAPATFLQQRLPVLHQQLPVDPATTSPEPVTHLLHQQTPAITSPEPETTFLHQQILATTSPEPATTFLHQQIPVLNQRPSSCTSGNQSCTSDHLSKLYELSRPASATRSCSNDHHPAAAIVRRTLFSIYDSP